MDKLWCLISLFIWIQTTYSEVLNCTRFNSGTFSVVCYGATKDFKNTTIKFDELADTVRCENCSLPVLEEKAFDDNHIINLDLRSSGIKTIKPGAFTGLNFLEKLQLSDNFLTQIVPSTFADLRKLRVLTIQNNNLTSLEDEAFANATNLKKLNLHKNHISVIKEKAFYGLKNLLDLDLSMNNISKFNGTFTGLSAVQNLNLSFNSIALLEGHDFEDLTSLTKLSLDHNNMLVLPAEGFPNLPLIFLDVSHNTIIEVNVTTFRHLYLLEQLDLSDNRIRYILKDSFQRMNELHDLDLSSNKLSVFETGNFSSGLPELRALNLSNNYINSVEITGVFRLESLQTLDLSSNNISNLDYNSLVLKTPKLSYLDLFNNSLPCYLKEDMELFFVHDNLEIVYSKKNGIESKCRNVTKPVNPKKDGNSKGNHTIHETTTNHYEAITKAADIIKKMSNKTITDAEKIIADDIEKVENEIKKSHSKMDQFSKGEYYNSRPAIVVIFVMLAVLMVIIAILSYSHCITRRIVKQHCMHRALSQIRLFSNDVDFDSTGNL